VDCEQKVVLQKLMARLADGDRAAFDPLYEILWPLVRRFTERALGGSADAEDAAQMTLMKIFSRAAEFDPDRGALSWVLGVASYECRTFRQKRRRLREDSIKDEEGPHSGPDSSPEEAAIKQDLEAAAFEALGALQPVDVETIQAVLDGRQPEMPAATFRKRVSRAISRWRSVWSSRHGTD